MLIKYLSKCHWLNLNGKIYVPCMRIDKMKDTNTKREYSLDFIKIVATILIVFHHYQQVIGVYYNKGVNFAGGKFYFGYIVELFFVLSGYFMYSYIAIIQNQKVDFLNFYLKRLGRLAPLMAIGAISYEILLVIYEYIYGQPWFDIKPTFWGTIIASLGIQDGWGLTNPCVNNPTWYISVLLLCYIVFYMSVYIASRWNIKPQYIFAVMIFLGMGIQTYGIDLPFLNASSARGYYAFFFGILLAGFLKRKYIGVKWMIVNVITVLILTVLIVLTPDFMDKGINYIMTFIYYPAVIIFFKSQVVKKVFDNNIWGRLGRISFDVYIWHNPFFILLFILIKIFNWNLNLSSCWFMIVYAIICYLFGTISHYFIEKPLNRLVANKFSELIIMKE